MKLRHKLFLVTTLYFVITASVVIGAVLIFGGSKMKEMTMSVHKAQIDRAMSDLNRFFFERMYDMVDLSEKIQDLNSANGYDKIQEKLFQYRNEYKVYQSLSFYDTHQVKRVDTNRMNLNQQYHLPFWDKMISKTDSFYDFYYDPDTKKTVIIFAHAILNRRGNLTGVVVGSVPMGTVYQITKKIDNSFAVNVKHEVDLLTHDGKLLYSNHMENLSVEQATSSGKWLAVYNTMNKDGLHYQVVEDRDRVAIVASGDSSQSFKNQNWFVVVNSKKNQILSEVYDLGILLTIFFFIIFAVFILASLKVSQSIARPLELITRRVKEIGFGNFDALKRFKKSDDEVGQLAAHINAMALKIEDLITDSTQKERMKALGQMSASIAHEINNPLAIIAIRVESLLTHLPKDYPNSEKLEKGLKNIYDTSYRIAKIVRGLKSLSREGTSDPFIPSSTSDLIETTIVFCNESLKTHQVQLHIEKPVDDIEFECRSHQISQILLNLINNAVDAVKTQEGERWVRLNVSKTSTHIIFKTSNSGKKIPEDVAKNLFRPFFTTKTAGKGTGLGLSISLSIAKSHYGTLEVDLSETCTCFVLTLPLYHSPQQVAA